MCFLIAEKIFGRLSPIYGLCIRGFPRNGRTHGRWILRRLKYFMSGIPSEMFTFSACSKMSSCLNISFFYFSIFLFYFCYQKITISIQAITIRMYVCTYISTLTCITTYLFANNLRKIN